MKFLVVLGLLGFIYSLGSYSFLHGVLYLLVPYLDKAREAGRFIYFTHFAMALLAGFGIQTLFIQTTSSSDSFSRFMRFLRWGILALLLIFGIPSIYGRPEINEWSYVSFLFIISAVALLSHVFRGNRGWIAQFLLVALIAWDLHVFNWTIQNRFHEERAGRNYLAQLVSTRNLADFFQSQPGLFRVHVEGDWAPNMGDMYEIQTTGGNGVTALQNYLPFVWSPHGLAMLNVRYRVTAAEQEGTPVFSDGKWKVYENSIYFSRAWLVPQVRVEASDEEVLRQVRQGSFDPSKLALVSDPPEVRFADSEDGHANIRITTYQPNQIELSADTLRGGLLVISEIYYPGWEATLNGETTHIYKVNGMIRGIVVTPGQNRIIMQYRPASVRRGAALSLAAVLAMLILGAVILLRKRSSTVS